MKALGKHTLGALKHGAAGALQAASRAMHHQVSSQSGKASELANSYGLAAEMTRPLAKNEKTTAKIHLMGLRLAAKDLLHRAGTYDAGAIAQQLSWLKEQRHSLQSDKKEVLALGSQSPLPSPATQDVPALPTIGPMALMVHTRRPRLAAAKAASAAVRHAAAGAYHKAREGMHFIGAKARTDAPAIAQAHRMARASHSAKAAVSFADASVQAKHAVHYTVIAKRGHTPPDQLSLRLPPVFYARPPAHAAASAPAGTVQPLPIEAAGMPQQAAKQEVTP